VYPLKHNMSDHTYYTDRYFFTGTHVCKGDSGSGFYSLVPVEDGRRRWHLMGVLSRTLPLPDDQICLNDSHFIFSDVTKMLPWLLNELREAESK
jgi:hypothetical protein